MHDAPNYSSNRPLQLLRKGLTLSRNLNLEPSPEALTRDRAIERGIIHRFTVLAEFAIMRASSGLALVANPDTPCQPGLNVL